MHVFVTEHVYGFVCCNWGIKYKKVENIYIKNTALMGTKV